MSLPLLLNVRDRLVVVVGGGTVGQRRARTLHEAGATVRVIDPVPAPGGWFTDWCQELFQPGHLDGALVAIAAASREVNQSVVREARARGVLVASASEPDTGDFTFPATRQRGPIVLSVSTSGASPTLARQIADGAIANIAERTVALADLLREHRPRLLRELTPGRYNQLLTRLLAPEVSIDECRSMIAMAFTRPTEHP